MRDKQGKPLTVKKSIPLSSLDDEPEKAGEYFQPILDFIVQNIPESKHHQTGIYIMATAGMRLLDEPTQESIMDITSKYIKDKYNFARVRTSVISGAEEGMYQWISVNAKAKRFLDKNTDVRTKTYAVIEMGGASIQVTYQMRSGLYHEIKSSLSKEIWDIYTAQLIEPAMSKYNQLEQEYVLHSTTFLGFGSNSARDAYIDLLIKNNEMKQSFSKWQDKLIKSLFGKPTSTYKWVLNDPCLPRDHIELVKKPKRMLSIKNQTIGFALDDDEPYFEVKLRGSGNHRKCKGLVTAMLNTAKKEKLNCKPDEKCTMLLLGESFVPFDTSIHFDFYAIGDFFHTTNLMLRSAGNYNHEKIVYRTQHICNSSYKELTAMYPEVAADKTKGDRIAQECFKAVWVDTFLVKGLIMPYDFNSLKTVNKIKGDDPEWTLGAILDKSYPIEKAAEGEYTPYRESIMDKIN